MKTRGPFLKLFRAQHQSFTSNAQLFFGVKVWVMKDPCWVQNGLWNRPQDRDCLEKPYLPNDHRMGRWIQAQWLLQPGCGLKGSHGHQTLSCSPSVWSTYPQHCPGTHKIESCLTCKINMQFLKYNLLLSIHHPTVVYFDQQKGAAHLIPWSE